MDVSIVIPAFNEEETIEELLNEVYKVFLKNKYNGNIIVVDDHSIDKTTIICKKLEKKIPILKVISHKKRLGKADAIQSGLKVNKTKNIVMIDADYQYDPKDIPKIVNELKNGYQLVSGWRIKRKDSITRLLFSYFFNLINRILFRIKLHDVNCGLKGFTTEVFVNIEIEFPKWFIDTEILAKLYAMNIPIKEVPIIHYPRLRGTSKISCIQTAIETLINSFKLKLLIIRKVGLNESLVVESTK